MAWYEQMNVTAVERNEFEEFVELTGHLDGDYDYIFGECDLVSNISMG